MKSSLDVAQEQNATVNLTMEEVQKEMELISDEAHKEFHKGHPYILVMISNKPLECYAELRAALADENNLWPKGVLVVCGQTFSQFMGALAHRRIHRPADPVYSRQPSAASMPVGNLSRLRGECCTCQTKCARKNCTCKFFAVPCNSKCHPSSTACRNIAGHKRKRGHGQNKEKKEKDKKTTKKKKTEEQSPEEQETKTEKQGEEREENTHKKKKKKDKKRKKTEEQSSEELESKEEKDKGDVDYFNKE